MGPGGAFKPNEIIMTIARPRPLFVRAYVDEKTIRHIRKGVAGKVMPTAYPTKRLDAKVNAVTIVPVQPGKFDTRIEVKAGPKDHVLPGMTCNVQLIAYQKDDALTVPSSAVFVDPDNADQKVVYLSKEDGQEKRVVKVGKTSGKKVEITDGLAEGDAILLKKPQ